MAQFETALKRVRTPRGIYKNQLTDAFLRKFASRLFPVGDCIEWTGILNKDGYGLIHIKKSKFLAHRVAFAIANGYTPCSLFVCHSCDNPKCVNPKHLFVGTQKENMADAVKKSRMRRGDLHGLRLHPEAAASGERNGNCKLYKDQVEQIRFSLNCGIAQREIAKSFGVSQAHVSRISRGTRWRLTNGEI